jgi:hypothetical protein
VTLAEIAREIQNGILDEYSWYGTKPSGPAKTNLYPAYERLGNRWMGFIDSLMAEWQTLNIVSGLLLSYVVLSSQIFPANLTLVFRAIMTIFQIDGAANDPITRYIAFWSLICALISLLYGCIFVIRFSSMKKIHRGIEWAAVRQSRLCFNLIPQS